MAASRSASEMAGLGRSRRPSARPSADQRARTLHLGPQQFDLHRELADALHGGGELAFGWITLALLERTLERHLGLLPPLLELEQRQAELAREQLGRLATHQPQHHLAFASRAPALVRCQPAQGCAARGRRGGLAWGQRGRAAPALADHRPHHRIVTLILVHAALHHIGPGLDKWVSSETGCSSWTTFGNWFSPLRRRHVLA